MQGNRIEGAGPILEAGFRAAREARWSNGSDSIYQLVLQFKTSTDASAYFDLAHGPTESGSVEGLDKARSFESRDNKTGGHFVSVLIVRGEFIAVTQYTSHSETDPREKSRQLSMRESELLRA